MINDMTLYYLRSFAVLLVISVIGCTSLVKNTATRLESNKKLEVPVAVIECILLILLLVVCTGYLVDGSFSPFLYFRF